MTRKLLLASLALTCATCVVALIHPGFAFAILGAALILPLPIAGPVAFGLGTAAAFVLGGMSPAFAVEVATVGDKAVILPWGDIIVGIAEPVFSVLAALIAGMIAAAIARFMPWLMQWVSKAQIEATVKRVMDYGLNATRGAAKGQTVKVDVGHAALARAVQYAADNASPLVIKAAGGLPGVAEKVFRKMDLEPEANASNVLAPVLSQIQAGEIKKST